VSQNAGYERETRRVRLLPPSIVDRLPDRLWAPGNLRRLGPLALHFCDEDHVKSIEINGRCIAQGRRLFPYSKFADD
jgi:hypothetical protein